MKKKITWSLCIIVFAAVLISFRDGSNEAYTDIYRQRFVAFSNEQAALLRYIEQSDVTSERGIEHIRKELQVARNSLKGMDFWLRYLEPTIYKKLNGPLPVEWETEVFEKFEKPYKREGAGLTLAQLYLDEPVIIKDTLLSLIKTFGDAMQAYSADSITKNLTSYHHFFLCNRLYLLNLASIYTTGFECPDPEQIIPELKRMLVDVNLIYKAYNASFPQTQLTDEYLALYAKTIAFCNAQPEDYTTFDHFTFIRDYVNPLYALNQQMVLAYKVASSSMIDYTLNKSNTSIFRKDIYNGQNSKGLYLRVKDTAILAEIDRLGKLLFYDPILSGNNMRSCASCHKPTEYFTDTMNATAFQYNHKDLLPRNTPSLINVSYNHLVMADGKHFTLQNQTKGVITSPIEMGCSEEDVLKRVLSCKEYKMAFTKLLQYTPQEPQITFEHIASAITLYYGKFSKSYAPFDDAMNKLADADAATRRGFNLFMSKAQCATCHFVPQFNGVKPPFVGSEFEVLGVPEDTAFKNISADKGRYEVNPAVETMHAFRTGSIRNAAHTAPYMHNGVFTTMEQVIDFYDAGGGKGRGLNVENQTLASDSLKLTKQEKKDLIQFIASLDERVPFENPPVKLPVSSIKELSRRKVGGVY